MKVTILLTICSMLGQLGFGQSSDGSKCPGTTCQGPTPGANCDPRYERDDGCCPVWYCTTSNGYTSTTYGKMSSGGGSSQSSYSSYSSSSGSGGGSYSQSSSSSSGSFGNLPGFPGLGGFQIKLPGLGNLFG